jgi:carbonic anhydrase
MMNLKTLKSDLPSSIVVFLVALPLCLGIALASGAPLLSGLVSGIVGGIVVGIISKSHTSVSGPAAGLAAVVLSSITKLGTFELFLTAVIIAGVLQLIMGVIKLGFLADFIPNNVIKGLLAAIGVILMMKQIPHAIGFDRDTEGDFTFFQKDGENTFSELLSAFNYITPGALLIAILSLLIMTLWDKTPMKKVKFFPASLFVVILGVALNYIFIHNIPSLAIQSTHLVSIPPLNLSNPASLLHIPNIADFSNLQLWIVAFTIAVIASVETLLNIEAVDKLDTHKRNSPPNRELIAQGFGNIVSGFLGGIPVTSVIVRSSVNINSGSETKLSAIIHGFFLVLSILFLSPILNQIPLASLAAILLITGYKLANITLFKNMYNRGWEQFVPFVVTVLAIVFSDLLIGVIIGLVVSIFYILRSNFRNPFLKERNATDSGEVLKLELPNQVSFFNKSSIKETLWSAPEKSTVRIDATYTNYIDYDVLDVIEDFKKTVAPEKNIQLEIIGLKENISDRNR